MKKSPQPRGCSFTGVWEKGTVAPDGTWLEPESLCYPKGGISRFAFATCEDGVRRKVKCGIPDTFFTIPASCKIGEKTVRGFVTGGDGGYRFIAYSQDK